MRQVCDYALFSFLQVAHLSDYTTPGVIIKFKELPVALQYVVKLNLIYLVEVVLAVFEL